MDGGYPVDGVATDDGKVRHVDPLLPVLLDAGQSLHLLPIVAVLFPDRLHVKVVNLVNDLQVTGEKLLHH